MTSPRQALYTGGRRYLWPPTGQKLPSVTTILRQKKSWALEKWTINEITAFAHDEFDAWGKLPRAAALKALADAPWRSSTLARERGDEVHAILEALSKGEEPMVDPDLLPYVAAGQAFFDEWVEEVIWPEPMIFNLTYEYAGSADLVARIREDRGGGIGVFDYKTGKGLYPDVAWQLIAYARGEFVGTHVIDTDHTGPTGEPGPCEEADHWTEAPLPQGMRAFAVLLKEDAGYVVKEADTSNQCWEEFVGLRRLQAWEDGRRHHRFIGEWAGNAMEATT